MLSNERCNSRHSSALTRVGRAPLLNEVRPGVQGSGVRHSLAPSMPLMRGCWPQALKKREADPLAESGAQLRPKQRRMSS